MLDDYCRLFDTPTGPWRRIDGMHKLGIPRATLLRRLAFYGRILTVRRK